MAEAGDLRNGTRCSTTSAKSSFSRVFDGANGFAVQRILRPVSVDLGESQAAEILDLRARSASESRNHAGLAGHDVTSCGPETRNIGAAIAGTRILPRKTSVLACRPQFCRWSGDSSTDAATAVGAALYPPSCVGSYMQCLILCRLAISSSIDGSFIHRGEIASRVAS
ncbi:MAG: hypothetical protein IPH26_05830 [Sterolibacteriaceae bacterium]|uniref:Uncharacterized protein n=1 Tax=Candidatus Methylophosphatis roskildensis TaxID=2899263 RepID=A0A9D7HQJ7_9PROT|nr:hypothetical protein [Candidatus Methylophosphatis roskildensis]